MQLCRLLIIICFLKVLSISQLQAQHEMNVIISASVSGSVELISIKSMTLSGTDAQNGIITINPLTSANAGKMIATGSPNLNIRISYLRRRELTRVEGNSTLIFNYNLAGNTLDDQSSATPLDNENRDFEFNDQGRFYIWLGGSVDISKALPGSYQGEFTLEIEYI